MAPHRNALAAASNREAFVQKPLGFVRFFDGARLRFLKASARGRGVRRGRGFKATQKIIIKDGVGEWKKKGSSLDRRA